MRKESGRAWWGAGRAALHTELQEPKQARAAFLVSKTMA